MTVADAAGQQETESAKAGGGEAGGATGQRESVPGDQAGTNPAPTAATVPLSFPSPTDQ